jgi:drug/metabolite transporter (DMT)-like permease
MITVVDPIAATLIGALFFGESLTVQGAAPVLEVASIAAMVAGVFMLGRSPLVHCTQGSGTPEPAPSEYAGTGRA